MWVWVCVCVCGRVCVCARRWVWRGGGGAAAGGGGERAGVYPADGLGTSQKAEVAWLEREGIPYEEVDVYSDEHAAQLSRASQPPFYVRGIG